MKTLITLIITTVFSLTAYAEPKASPTPKSDTIDSLGIVTRTATAPVLSLEAKQKNFRTGISFQCRMMFQNMARGYEKLRADLSTDDSVAGGLTIQQKQDALTADDKTELATNAWLIANILNGLKQGTVPNPLK